MSKAKLHKFLGSLYRLLRFAMQSNRIFYEALSNLNTSKWKQRLGVTKLHSHLEFHRWFTFPYFTPNKVQLVDTQTIVYFVNAYQRYHQQHLLHQIHLLATYFFKKTPVACAQIFRSLNAINYLADDDSTILTAHEYRPKLQRKCKGSR